MRGGLFIRVLLNLEFTGQNECVSLPLSLSKKYLNKRGHVDLGNYLSVPEADERQKEEVRSAKCFRVWMLNISAFCCNTIAKQHK